MEGLKLIPYIALVMTIAGIVIGASVITVSKFKENLAEDECYNASFNTIDTKSCENTTVELAVESGCCGKGGLNYSQAGYISYKSIEGLNTVAEQQPTVAIISVMVIIISIIAGVFVYMKYFA